MPRLADALGQRLARGVAPESPWGLCQACGHLTYVETLADLGRTPCRHCGQICYAAEGGETILGSGAAPPSEEAFAARQEELLASLQAAAHAPSPEWRWLQVESWYWAHRFPVSTFRIPALLREQGESDLADMLDAAIRESRG